MSDPEGPFVRIRGSANADRINDLRVRMDGMFRARSLAVYPPEVVDVIKKSEIPKTPEQQQVLSICNEVTNEYLVELGFSAADIPSDNFLIVPHEVFVGLVREDAPAVSSPFQQVIFIDESSLQNEPLSYFASTALHEMIQLKGPAQFWAYKSFNEENPLNNMRLRQWGVGVYSTPKDASDKGLQKVKLGALEEAIIADIQKHLFRKIFLRAPFKKERDAASHGKERRRRKQLAASLGMSEDEIYRAMDADNGHIYALHFPYYEQRRVFDYISRKIRDEYPERFKTPADVRKLFHTMRFSLRLLELGRLIKRTFGVEGLHVLSAMSSAEGHDAKIDETLRALEELRQMRLEERQSSR